MINSRSEPMTWEEAQAMYASLEIGDCLRYCFGDQIHVRGRVDNIVIIRYRRKGRWYYGSLIPEELVTGYVVKE